MAVFKRAQSTAIWCECLAFVPSVEDPGVCTCAHHMHTHHVPTTDLPGTWCQYVGAPSREPR